jgi:hypothetical protein
MTDAARDSPEDCTSTPLLSRKNARSLPLKP